MPKPGCNLSESLQVHVTKVLYDMEQEAAGRKVRRPKKQKNLQKDAAILALVEEYPRIKDKRRYLEKVARLTSVTMKL